jgi:hypothetical protein
MSDRQVYTEASPTEAELAAIIARANAADRGPWWVDHGRISFGEGFTNVAMISVHSGGKANEEFIVNSRRDIARLIAAISERDTIMTDMLQDQPAFDRGVQEGIRLCLERLRSVRWQYERESYTDKSDGHNLFRVQALHDAVDSVLEMANLSSGESPTPIPSIAARVRNRKLEEALLKAAEHLDRYATNSTTDPHLIMARSCRYAVKNA